MESSSERVRVVGMGTTPQISKAIDLLGTRQSYCSNHRCRLSATDILPTKMTRCSRCKEAHYCSRDCQRLHFPFHKGNCKRIAKLREKCLAQGDMKCLEGEVVECTQEGGASKTMMVSCKEQLADAIFLEGYHSSDTMDRAASIYVSSVTHYLDLRHKGCYDWVDVIKPAILLVALGRDDMAFTILVDYSSLLKVGVPEGLKPGDWFLPITKCSEPFAEFTLSSIGHVKSFIGVIKAIIVLLSKLRLISNGTMDLFAKTDAGALLTPLLPTISQYVRGNDEFQRRQLDHALRLLDSPSVKSAACKLRDCILLSTGVDEEERYREVLPDEFLHLLQDCYFLSPGVSDLLQELLPDEGIE